jgi:hypothetical protein
MSRVKGMSGEEEEDEESVQSREKGDKKEIETFHTHEKTCPKKTLALMPHPHQAPEAEGGHKHIRSPCDHPSFRDAIIHINFYFSRDFILRTLKKMRFWRRSIVDSVVRVKTYDLIYTFTIESAPPVAISPGSVGWYLTVVTPSSLFRR